MSRSRPPVTEQRFQPSAPSSEDAGRPVDAPGLDREEAPALGLRELPSRMLPQDMMRAFHVKQARFYALVQQGKFDRFELRPRIGRRAWSGRLVQEYFDQIASIRSLLKRA